MTRITDGGPIFGGTRREWRRVLLGQPDHQAVDVTYDGMTLRDWFAGQALMMMYAQTNHEAVAGHDEKTVAAWAYEIADAMLAERDK